MKEVRAKLTDEQVTDIRRRLAAGEPGTALEAAYSISSSQVSRIKTGKRHGHLAGALPARSYDPEWKCSRCGAEIDRPKHNITAAQRAKRCCATCKKIKSSVRQGERTRHYTYKPRVNLTGLKFGRLVAVMPSKKRGQWECLCDCGRMRSVLAASLRSGNTRSCGCLVFREDLEKLRERHDAGLVAWYDGYRRSAGARQHAFGLSIEVFASLVTADCYYCGARPSMVARGAVHKFNGIDRMNNGVGYVDGNCVPCCTTCNNMKATMNSGDFIALARQIAARHACHEGGA